MTATLRGYTVGWLTTDMAGMLEGADSAPVRMPVLSYLIEHAKGRIVFDTGLHPDVRVDARQRIGGVAEFFETELAEGTAVDERVQALEASPDLVVCSHLHFDHCGGTALLGDVTMLVQRAEWEAAHGGDPTAGYNPTDFDTGQTVQLLDGEHDLFGDGSVVCIPTPGHTMGHQSLRVRTGDREVVLTADACYFRQSLEESRLPLFGFDREAQHRSQAVLRTLEAGGAHLVFGHDPAQWAGDEPVTL